MINLFNLVKTHFMIFMILKSNNMHEKERSGLEFETLY